MKFIDDAMSIKLHPMHQIRFLKVFLDAFSHLYKRLCLSVGRFVGRFVGPSVTHELESLNNAIFQ